MTALLRGVPRSGREGGQGGRRGGGLQEQLIGPVPPPLRRRTADRLPADHPLLPLHGPLREDEILPERRRQPRAARGQPPTALGAAAEPTGLAGSGRICPLRTDHLRDVQADRGNFGHGRLLQWCHLDRHSGTPMPSGGVHPISRPSDSQVRSWPAATLVGGAGPGLLALALGGLGAWYFVLPPRLAFAGLSTSDAVSLALYALSCGFLILLATALRRALMRARSAEAALDESEGRLLLAQEAAGIGAWDWDPQGGRDRWSAAQSRLFGRDPAAGAPDHAAFVAYLHPDDRGRVDAALRAALAGGAAYDVEFRIQREDGAERWLLGWGRLLRDADGRPVGMAGINMDVTERRAAEERQGLLLQELAHRVKNTLAVVQGIANRSLSGDRTLAEARE